MRALQEQRDNITEGILFLIQINELQPLNRLRGHQAGDELLKAVALVLQEITQPYANSVLSRLMGGDFGVLLPDTPPWNAVQIATDMANALIACRSKDHQFRECSPHRCRNLDVPTPLGACCRKPIGMRMAQQNGPNFVAVVRFLRDKNCCGDSNGGILKRLCGKENPACCSACSKDGRPQRCPSPRDFLENR